MRSRIWIALIALLALSITISGCGLLQGAREVTDAVKEVAEQIDSTDDTTPARPVGDPDVEDPDDTDIDDIDDEIEIVDVDTLDSYRQTVTWTSTEGDETEEWSVTTEFVRNPPAQRTAWRGVDSDGKLSGWQMIQIGAVTYMRISDEGAEEEWMSMTSADAEDPQAQLDLYSLDSGDQYLRSGHCTQGRNMNYDGHPVIYFECDKEALGETFGLWLLGGRLTDGGVEMWISREYDVQVGNVTWWEGQDEDGVQHYWRTEQRVSDINVPFTIEPPAGVGAPGLPEDVPLIPGAMVTTAMSGMAGFEIDAELEDVVEYYREQMEDYGWTLESEFGEMLTYTKDGRQATLMFSIVADKVNGIVMITD